ncbi:MAG: TIGR00701 family protein [Legionellales bacterium]|nr:TIGR00701 family protein [Legionellales bacterium]|tara:strand:+ start:760 stop:1188 length:429 start_codon:yes stop_codon:yes gene_type:complete
MKSWLAWHIIFMVTWFSGIFYLPRLFVYHTEVSADDTAGQERFKTMERKLFWVITTPGGALTTLTGIRLIHYNYAYYMSSPWMHAKLSLVALLWVYHCVCGYYMLQFKADKNQHSKLFYIVFNEIPTVILISVVLLVFLKPA